MLAVEFKTVIKNGMIEIPFEYRKRLKDRVRVILLADEPRKPAIPTDLIGELLAHPLQIKGFRPLTREEIHAR